MEESVLLLFLFLSITASQTPVFQVHPVSINTTDGTTVEFTCTANNNPLFLIFLVNGTDVSLDDVEKGFKELFSIDLGGGIYKRRLLVTASVADNDNTQIRCRALDNNYYYVHSEVATLLVQGPLSAVADLSYSFIDSSTVNISWSPPFTLPGTNITGYNISATSNETTTNYFTSNSYYVIVLTNFHYEIYSCVLDTFVSGYNQLNGTVDSLTVPTFQPTASASAIVTSNLNTLVVFNVSKECIEHYFPVNFTTLNSDKEIIHSHMEWNNSMEDHKIVLVTDVVKEDNVYILLVSFSYAGYQVVNSFIYDTYGVESVAIPQVVDGIVTIICQFNSFSTDTGCTVQLVLQDNSTVQYTATFNRTGSIAEGNVPITVEGVYDIFAFDEGSTVVAASLLSMNITGPQLQPTFPTSGIITDSSDVPPTVFLMTTSILTAIVVAVVLIIGVFVLVLIIMIVLSALRSIKKNDGSKTSMASHDEKSTSQQSVEMNTRQSVEISIQSVEMSTQSVAIQVDLNPSYAICTHTSLSDNPSYVVHY